jgi:hypothetical protein
MTGRGWSAQDLPLVGEDPKLWTVTEAATALGPPCVPMDEIRLIARKLKPVGKRKTAGAGKPGRCARVYRAVDFIAAYEKWA